MIRSSVNPEVSCSIPLDMPIVNFRDPDMLMIACRQYLSGLGVKPALIQAAIQQAQQAQAAYKLQVIALGAELISKARSEDSPLIMLIGRPVNS